LSNEKLELSEQLNLNGKVKLIGTSAICMPNNEYELQKVINLSNAVANVDKTNEAELNSQIKSFNGKETLNDVEVDYLHAVKYANASNVLREEIKEIDANLTYDKFIEMKNAQLTEPSIVPAQISNSIENQSSIEHTESTSLINQK
jgi:hypothetical protein